MTSTKIAYLIAVVVPFGFVVLAVIALLHAFAKRRKLETSAAAATNQL